jgi:transcriptional regulator with XRE-family HTH domain
VSSLGKKIRLMRHEKGWSQSDLAKQLDISIPAYSKIESGITDINLSRVQQIAAVFNLTAVELFADTNVKPENSTELEELQERLKEREEELILLQKKVIDLYEEAKTLSSKNQPALAE